MTKFRIHYYIPRTDSTGTREINAPDAAVARKEACAQLTRETGSPSAFQVRKVKVAA